MKTRSMLVLLGILIFTLHVYGCFQRLIAYDGLYRGRIVDAETKEPLEGVVILGVWHTETPSVGGGVMSYYDAREAVTDKNGDFSIPGQGLKVVTNLLPMRPIIFKSGYKYLQFFWDKESLNDERACGVKVTWDGKIPVIPLKKLSPEERHNPKSIYSSVPGPPIKAPYEKVKFFLKEMKKERIERRFKPFTEWGGVKL